MFIENKWHYGGEQFEESFYNFVRIYQENGFFHIVYKSKDKICLFVIMRYLENEKGNYSFCINSVEKFVKSVKEIFELEITIENYQVFENIYQVIDMREDIILKNNSLDEEIYLREQKKLIVANIMEGNINAAQEIMANFLHSCSQSDMQYCANEVVDIFSNLCNLLQNNKLLVYQKIRPYVNYRSVLEMNTVAEISLYCNRVFDKIKSEIGTIKELDENEEGFVGQIKKYVHKHIYEDIVLEDVANELFISTTHLSRIFKKQTGETFLQYVTRNKLEKAKELLGDPQYKVYHVAEKLGYKTPHYFSKLFYNHIGCYPKQYRKDVLKLEGILDEEE